MEQAALTLYLVMPQNDWAECQRQGHISGQSYIGLREEPRDAWERMAIIKRETAKPEEHVLVTVTFTMQAFVEYGRKHTNMEKDYAPTLHKVIYQADKTKHDWKVWHFHADHPLLRHGFVSCVVHTRDC